MVIGADQRGPHPRMVAQAGYYAQENNGLLAKLLQNQKKEIELAKVTAKSAMETKRQAILSRIVGFFQGQQQSPGANAPAVSGPPAPPPAPTMRPPQVAEFAFYIGDHPLSLISDVNANPPHKGSGEAPRPKGY